MAEAKVRADVSGSIWKVLVKAGDTVAEGDDLIIIESMKMEIPAAAPAAGTVRSVTVAEGDRIEENAVLATIETA